MSDIENDADIPPADSITVAKISKFLHDAGFMCGEIFYDSLALPRKHYSELRIKKGYEQIKYAIESWVQTNGSSNATMGKLHDVFHKMDEIYTSEKLLELSHGRRECAVTIIDEINCIPQEETPFILKPVDMGDPDKELGNSSLCGAKSKKLFSRRTIIGLTLLAILTVLAVAYFTLPVILKFLRSNKNSKNDPDAEGMVRQGIKELSDPWELDTRLKPKIVVEDGIMTFLKDSHPCKNQPRRGIKLWLSELKLLNETLLAKNNSTHCLKNIIKYNITGPLRIEVLTKVIDYSPNLKELVFYRMQMFCSYCEDYLSHPTDQGEQNLKGHGSVLKLVFEGFGGNCARGISLLLSVVDTNNLAIFKVACHSNELDASCYFQDGELVAIQKLVDRSPHLMYFTCCGQNCNKFRGHLNDWIVSEDKFYCVIFRKS